MTALTDNFNMLSPTGFRVTIESPKFSNLEYFITTANLPEITLGAATATFRNSQSFAPGDKIEYSPLELTYLVDEDMKNYTEIFDWIYANANETNPTKHDVILTILSSHNNINKQIRFVRAIPTALQGLEFDTQAEGIEYFKSSVTLQYDYFEIIK